MTTIRQRPAAMAASDDDRYGNMEDDERDENDGGGVDLRYNSKSSFFKNFCARLFRSPLLWLRVHPRGPRTTNNNRIRRTCLIAMQAFLLLLLLFITVFAIAIQFHRDALLGRSSTDGINIGGGDLGKRFDNSVRTALFWYRQRSVDAEFRRRHRSAATAFPSDVAEELWLRKVAEGETNKAGVPVLTESRYRHVTDAAAARRDRRLEVEERMLQHDGRCPIQSNSPLPILLQPEVGDWYRPLRWWTAATTQDDESRDLNHDRRILSFDMADIDQFMYQHHNDDTVDIEEAVATLWDFYQERLGSQQQRVEFWGLCAVYFYGGIFVSPSVRSNEALDALLNDKKPRHPYTDEKSALASHKESCHGDSLLWFQQQDGRLSLVASNEPRNPRLGCLLALLKEQGALADSKGTNVDKDWTLNDALLIWVEAVLNSSVFIQQCQQSLRSSQRQSELDDAGLLDKGTTTEGSGRAQPKNFTKENGFKNSQSRRFSVEIREDRNTPPLSSPLPKRPWSRRLPGELGCTPSWWCHRCLRLPFFGTFSSCRRLCSCYADHVCPSMQQKVDGSLPQLWQQDQQEIVIRVQVYEFPNSTEKRIPRIIHQTWFEELTTTEYPHLQRLQHSWKAASGWDYRFYTDDDARRYIQSNFPGRFLIAYDAIAVPAFRADFFRLCVLAIDGGVYADIDVQLDANLDSFIPQNLSFFVPRDTNIDSWPSSNYCAWNGLMGASPGHPIVLQGLQDLVNRALHRQDYLDIENDLCRAHYGPNLEVWKLRCSPMLLLTGPCALGMSLNRALGKPPLKSLDIGWQHHKGTKHDGGYDWGDVLLLLLDRYDMGELRFTDVERNIILASTNQDRISTRPLSEQRNDSTTTSNVALHYSNFESDIVGMRAYIDGFAYNERVLLEIEHSYA